jgi:protein ImuA
VLLADAPASDETPVSLDTEDGQAGSATLAPAASVPASAARPDRREASLAWTLGDDRLDTLLPGGSLALGALHELKPASARDWPAALAFALRLAVRRLATAADSPEHDRQPATGGQAEPLVLWCATSAFTAEHGRLHAPGLAALGLPAEALLIAETDRQKDTLWVLEEGLRSGAPALVVGCLDAAALTPARRLSLATAAGRVPCLIVTAPRTPAAPATATRWRIARTPSAPHPFDAAAPGAPRLAVTLEHSRLPAGSRRPDESRLLPAAGSLLPHVVEWCDVAHRFRLAAGLADRPAAPVSAPARTRGPAVRAG